MPPYHTFRSRWEFRTWNSLTQLHWFHSHSPHFITVVEFLFSDSHFHFSSNQVLKVLVPLQLQLCMYAQTLSCGSSESLSWKLCGCVMSFSFSFFFQCVFSSLVFYENWCQISVVCHSPPSPVWQRPCQSEEICDRQAGLYFKMSPNSVTFPTAIIRLMWESQCSSVSFSFVGLKWGNA